MFPIWSYLQSFFCIYTRVLCVCVFCLIFVRCMYTDIPMVFFLVVVSQFINNHKASYYDQWSSSFFLAAAEGEWSGMVPNPCTLCKVKEAYYCNNNCIQSDKECLKCWIDKGQRPDYIMKTGATHVTHLYPQWIFVQSRNEICRTLLPASAISPTAWLMRHQSCHQLVILQRIVLNICRSGTIERLHLASQRWQVKPWISREKKGLNADGIVMDSSHLIHLHVFSKAENRLWVKKTSVVSHFCAGLEKNMCQLGFGWLLSWPGGIRALNEALFETMRFGSIWFTPDKTLGDLFEIGLITLKWSPQTS